MTYLLDNHTFLWYISDDAKLSKFAANLLEDSSHKAMLSIASLWEIAVKVSTTKLSLSMSVENLLKPKSWGLVLKLCKYPALI